jgi:hypothetical protein
MTKNEILDAVTQSKTPYAQHVPRYGTAVLRRDTHGTVGEAMKRAAEAVRKSQ